ARAPPAGDARARALAGAGLGPRPGRGVGAARGDHLRSPELAGRRRAFTALIYLFETMAPGEPRFGRAARADWGLDPDVTYLNHGTVGVVPLAVLEAQQKLRLEIERGPSQFLLRELARLPGVAGR